MGKLLLPILLLAILLSGCATHRPLHKQSYIVLIKSPKIRFNDIGYIIQSDDAIELQLYSAGMCIERFSIGSLVCTQLMCISKARFNEEYLNSAYESKLLEHILRRRPIFDAKGLRRFEGGFEQQIRSRDYDITYRVTKNSIYFRDSKNKILIKLKKMEQD